MTESVNFNVSVISGQAINTSIGATSGVSVSVVTGASGSSGSSGTSPAGESGTVNYALYATSSGYSGTAFKATSAGQSGTSLYTSSAGTALYATSAGQSETSAFATSSGNSGTALFAQTFGTGGSTGYIPKFSGSSGITVSQIYDAGTRIGIGTSSPDAQIGLLTLNADPSLYLTSSDMGAIPGIQNSSLCQISGTAAISSTYYYVSGHRRRVELLGTSLSSWQRLGIFAESTELINNSDQRKYTTVGQNVYVFHGNNGTATQTIAAYAQIVSTSGYIQDVYGYRNVVRIEPGEGGAATAGGVTGCNVNTITRIVGTSGTATLTGTSYAFNGNSYCSISKTGYINIPTLCGQKIFTYINNLGTAATAIVGLAYGILTGVGAVATSGGLAQIGTAYGAYIANGYGANTGTVGVAYGILIESQTNAGTNYAIKTGTAGSVILGIVAGTSGTALVGAGLDGVLLRIETQDVVAGTAWYSGTSLKATSAGNAGTALFASNISSAGTMYSLHISGDYMDGTAGSTGKVVNVYYGTAATMGTDGIPNGSIYFQYTA